ncbi:PREDICTED: zinc finger protein 831 [Chrysochloris asiatica]|uniref:Zinc finger protein 831 n=1 Tax=Chrysochloris asiatica TaxID=185453 RepID=A0A9B0T5D1_CHRAS|nr:PREDICTED: zinc finger protein 831 [Chrysochloris asiatica]
MWDGGPPTRDQPAQGLPAAPGRQGSPRLTLGPVLLPSEQGLAPTMLLPISLYHVVPPGGPKLRPALVPGGLEGASLPFILSPLLQPEGPGSTPLGKPSTPMLTVNLVSALPLLSPGPSPSLGSPSKVRSTGRYLCPHCGRDCLKPSVLEKHIRSHTGERPFPCDTCGIAFKTQSNLYKHRRTQTHLNNSRRSSESDGGGSNLLDEADRAGEPPGVDNSGTSRSHRGDEGPSESLDAKPETAACGGLSLADGEAPPDTRQKSPAASKLCSLQRQLATSWEKAWDTKGSSEGRLRKCESSDSGYLSRSDSSEQPTVPASPLRSLSERSADGEGGPGPGERQDTQELEKRWLEERIARLISHNQAVVDDPQLDTVRPRKTVLSKQGSIDLPMPYTYKDSFHFDMRALEPGRRRQATMGWAGSTCTPPDKTRPLSFHSVSTQFRTTMECVSVTRSNSLPFVESTRTWQEWEPDPKETCLRRQRPLSPRPAPAQLGGSWPAMPSSHPRALVRQTAVEDLAGTPCGESLVLAEDPPKTTAIEGTVSRGRGSRKRGDQRRLKMFSQEKWRVYRDETFKRIYQKDQMRVAASPQTEAKRAGVTRTPVSGDVKTPVCGEERTPVFGDILPPATMSSGSESEPRGGDQAAPEFSLVAEPPKSRPECSDEQEGKGAVKPPNLSCRDAPSLDLKTPQVPPNGRVEPAGDLSLGSDPLNGGDPGCSDRGEKGAHLWNTPRLAITGPGQAQATGNRLPSERKKLKVDGLGDQGQLKRPGAGGNREKTPEDPVQASSPSAGDSDLVERQGELPSSADCMDRGNHNGTSSAASSAVLRQAGPRDKERPLHPAAVPPGPHSQAPDNTFTPKYLLRLPQGETPSEPQASKGCEQGRGPLCWRRWPEEQVPSVGSGRSMPRCPGPASVRVSGETDSIPEVRDEVEGTQAREEDEDSLQTSPPTSRNPAVFISTSTLGSCLARNTEVETPTVHPLCLGSTSRPPGVAPNPWPPVREKVLDAPSSRSLNRLSASCPFQSGSFFSAITQPPAWPKLALPLHSGNPRSLGTKGAFPSLGTEPRLTWCCLSRSLPLPAEQKETSSVYSFLHLVRSSPQDEGPEGRTGISRGDPPSVPTSKVQRSVPAESCSIKGQQTAQSTLGAERKLPPSFTRGTGPMQAPPAAFF